MLEITVYIHGLLSLSVVIIVHLICFVTISRFAFTFVLSLFKYSLD